MNDLPEPTNNEQENLHKSGQKAYSFAIRTIAIGGVISLLFALLAISTLFNGKSDSAGLGFFVFGFLAIAIFIISGFIAILMSLAGVINYATIPNQNDDSAEDPLNGVVKNIGLILLIIFGLLMAFKLLKTIW